MTLFVINSRGMGRGDDELGGRLTASFLRKLWALETKPDALVFYNSGVKLLADDSDVLDALTGLSDSGVDLVACGTCVTFFQLSERLAIGRVSDMGEIVGLMAKADKVVTI